MAAEISVIIPTYNRANVLERAVQSVLLQQDCEFELIVVDDGSTDNTQEVLKNYKDQGVVRVFKTENRGVSAARNYAVEQAKGGWIGFLDSDDEWLPNKLKLQVDYRQSNPKLKLIHGEEVWIRNGKRVNPMKKHTKKGGDVFADALKLCCISPSTVFIEKDFFQSLGGFREDFPVCEDYDLWLKVTSKHSVGFVETPIIKKYGGHGDQLSRKFKAMDYWRVMAIDQILQGDLSLEKRKLARKELESKAQILLKGYRRHENLTRYDEIFKILTTHRSH